MKLQDAQKILVKINKWMVEHPQMLDDFVVDDIDFWQLYQHSILVDIQNGYEYNIQKKNQPQKTKHAISNIFFGLLIVFISLFSFLYSIISRKKILIYSVDMVSSEIYRNDFRLDSLYAYLKRDKVRFGEIMHAKAGMMMIKNLLKRGRPVMYLEAISVLLNNHKLFSRTFDLFDNDFTKDEEKIVQYVLDKYLGKIKSSLTKINLLSKMFWLLGTKHIISIDDVRYYHEIIIAAKKRGIPTYALQHGHFTKYHMGWLKYDSQSEVSLPAPDYFYVGSPYWKERLHDLNSYIPQDRIHVAHLSDIKYKEHGPIDVSEGIINILIPYETEAPHKEVLDYVELFLSCSFINVYFKVRSDMTAEDQLKTCGLDKFNHHDQFHVVTNVGKEDVVFHAVAGVYSTFLYDMISVGIPTLMFKTSFDYGAGMVDGGMADYIEKCDICDSVRNIVQHAQVKLVDRQKKFIPDTRFKSIACLLEEKLNYKNN
jgi:hypothetical protein